METPPHRTARGRKGTMRTDVAASAAPLGGGDRRAGISARQCVSSVAGTSDPAGRLVHGAQKVAFSAQFVNEKLHLLHISLYT